MVSSLGFRVQAPAEILEQPASQACIELHYAVLKFNTGLD